MISLKVQAIQRFTSTATAVEDLTAIQEGRLTDTFAKFLTEATGGASDGEKKKKKKLEETLIVAEAKLGTFTLAFLTDNQHPQSTSSFPSPSSPTLLLQTYIEVFDNSSHPSSAVSTPKTSTPCLWVSVTP
jgi:hypothetical protein